MSTEYPFTGTDNTVSTETELPLAKEYAWNFDVDRFIYDNTGAHVIVEGAEAIKVWIYKALKTKRRSYLAYSWQYGFEIEPFIGKLPTDARLSELKRAITECLMVNPYIKSIDNIDISRSGTHITINITLTTVYGEVNLVV